jgi:hypothetical protein
MKSPEVLQQIAELLKNNNLSTHSVNEWLLKNSLNEFFDNLGVTQLKIWHTTNGCDNWTKPNYYGISDMCIFIVRNDTLYQLDRGTIYEIDELGVFEEDESESLLDINEDFLKASIGKSLLYSPNELDFSDISDFVKVDENSFWKMIEDIFNNYQNFKSTSFDKPIVETVYSK